MSTSDEANGADTQAYTVPPVTRAIRLLQAISDGETAANLKQTALALAINRTTLMRLLHTLERARFIEPIPNGRGYRIGLGLVGIAARATQDLTQSATPLVTSLAESLGLSAHLGVLDGTDALFLLRQVPNVPLASNIQPGSRIPAYATTLGRIILAHWPKDRVTEVFRDVRFQPFSKHTPRSLSSLHAVLAADRAAGYAWSDSHYTPGVASVGFAVFNHTGEPAAALNVTGPQPLFTETEQRRATVIEAVRAAAHELSTRLGCIPAKTDTTRTGARRTARNERRKEFADIAEARMSATATIDYLSGIAMRAKGCTATSDFYVKNWGLTAVAQESGTIYFRGTGPEYYIYALREDDVFGVDYINFGVGSRASIDALHGRLTGLGITALATPAPLSTPGGGYGFTALDPDHRRLRFVTGVARHPDVADDAAKPRKITHVVLNTPQMEIVQKFFGDVLGMRVSDYSAEQMVFMRVASDHHAIALNRSAYPSVNHVAFEMPSIDAFMRGIGRMRTVGQAAAWGPGRHGPGNNPFAYFVSPSGFVIEFTAEVQQIDEATHAPQVWPRNVPEKMDVWMTAGPPTAAMRTVMQGRPDPGFPSRS